MILKINMNLNNYFIKTLNTNLISISNHIKLIKKMENQMDQREFNTYISKMYIHKLIYFFYI